MPLFDSETAADRFRPQVKVRADSSVLVQTKTTHISNFVNVQLYKGFTIQMKDYVTLIVKKKKISTKNLKLVLTRTHKIKNKHVLQPFSPHTLSMLLLGGSKNQRKLCVTEATVPPQFIHIKATGEQRTCQHDSCLIIAKSCDAIQVLPLLGKCTDLMCLSAGEETAAWDLRLGCGKQELDYLSCPKWNHHVPPSTTGRIRGANLKSKPIKIRVNQRSDL